MYQIPIECPACGETTLMIKRTIMDKPRLWCDTCTWEAVGVETGTNVAVFDINTEDVWASTTPELKEIQID
jgi:Zn finger protein HypA/HybF involved in hydrogenase expression